MSYEDRFQEESEECILSDVVMTKINIKIKEDIIWKK